jgi:peroxiredoxin
MSYSAYLTLSHSLFAGAIIALLSAIVFLVWAIAGWRGPKRKRRLGTFVALAATFFVLNVASQYVLAYWVIVPPHPREGQEAMRVEQDKGALTKVGDIAPTFVLTTEAGTVFDLDELRGNVVIINFFATWCAPCVQFELPRMQELWEEFHERDDFSLIVIGCGETNESIASFESKYGFSFPMVADPQQAAYSRYASESIPRTYVISRHGTIAFQSIGSDEEDFTKIKEVLANQLRTPN